MTTKQLFYFIIASIFIAVAAFAENKEESPEQYYKIESYNEDISCLKPYMVENTDQVQIVNKEEVVYLIELIGAEGSCSYESERLIFKKNTPLNIVNSVLASFKPKIKMESSFKLKFNVKKIRKGVDVGFNSIKIPYFIVVNNRITDEIISQDSYSIMLPLGNIVEQVYETDQITLNKEFYSSDFINIEVLLGIYFKSVDSNVNKVQ